MKQHEDACECEICKNGLDAMIKRQQEEFKKCGWVADIVHDDPDTPFGFNYHTHGFEHTFKQPDIQIVFPMPPRLAHFLANRIVHLLKDGTVIEPGKLYPDIVDDMHVKFMAVLECERIVHRAILPDRNGKFDTLPYSRQIENPNHHLKTPYQA